MGRPLAGLMLESQIARRRDYSHFGSCPMAGHLRAKQMAAARMGLPLAGHTLESQVARRKDCSHGGVTPQLVTYGQYKRRQQEGTPPSWP